MLSQIKLEKKKNNAPEHLLPLSHGPTNSPASLVPSPAPTSRPAPDASWLLYLCVTGPAVLCPSFGPAFCILGCMTLKNTGIRSLFALTLSPIPTPQRTRSVLPLFTSPATLFCFSRPRTADRFSCECAKYHAKPWTSAIATKSAPSSRRRPPRLIPRRFIILLLSSFFRDHLLIRLLAHHLLIGLFLDIFCGIFLQIF